MSGSRKLKTGAIALVAIAATIGVATLVYRHLTWVDEDLDQLVAYAPSHGYAAMIHSLQDQTIPPEGLRFVVLGDTRSNMPVARDIVIRAAKEQPAFILNTGDLVRPATIEQYISYHLPLAKATAPIPHIPVPGNHEIGPNRNFAGFKVLYGDERFSFDYAGCRFVGVNNGDRLRMGHSDLRYLETRLAKPGAQHKFVIIHIPPDYVKASVGRGFKWNAGRFRRLMQRMDVDHVFMGHIHGYATEAIDGIPYTITGGGGAPLTDKLGREGNVRNYVVVHVTPDGLQREVVRRVGEEWVRSPIR